MNKMVLTGWYCVATVTLLSTIPSVSFGEVTSPVAVPAPVPTDNVQSSAHLLGTLIVFFDFVYCVSRV